MGVCGEGIRLAYLTTYFPELFVNTYSSKSGKVKMGGQGKGTFSKSITEFVLKGTRADIWPRSEK